MAPRRSSALFLLAVVGMAAFVQPAAAFCVYNTGSTQATFLAWPLSGQTFKKVVDPGKSECCNWANPTCFATDEGKDGPDHIGQCADVVFYVAPRSLDTNAITSKLVQKEVEEALAPLIAIAGVGLSPIPGVGEVVGIAAAMGAAGLDLTAVQTATGVDFQEGDKLVHASNGGALDFNPDTGDVTTFKAPICP